MKTNNIINKLKINSSDIDFDTIKIHIVNFLKDKHNYNICILSLFWSWNYGIWIEWQSDFDAIAVVIPTIEQLIRRQVISEEIEIPNWYGHIDIKDVYSFFQKITSLNYLEVVYSNCIIDNEFLDIFDFIKNKVVPNQSNAIKAKIISNFSAYKKQVQFEKDEIKKNKYLSHIYRLKILYDTFDKTWQLKFKLEWEQQEKCLNIKLWKQNINIDEYNLPEIKSLDFKQDNNEILKQLENMVVEVVKKRF